jgi:hypothetical protein
MALRLAVDTRDHDHHRQDRVPASPQLEAPLKPSINPEKIAEFRAAGANANPASPAANPAKIADTYRRNTDSPQKKPGLRSCRLRKRLGGSKR